MRVETLFLDAGGVLVEPNWVRVGEVLAAHGMRVDPARLAAAEPAVKHAIDTAAGIASTTDASRARTYFDWVLEGAGVPRGLGMAAALEELKAYHASHNLWERVPEDVPPTLARLRRGGLRLVVVSNANGTLRANLSRLGLAPFLDHVLDSFEEGVEKPDPRLFEIALERSGGRRETTLHVGDLYHVDVLGARAARLRALLLDPSGLHADRDCPRIASFSELADVIPLTWGSAEP